MRKEDLIQFEEEIKDLYLDKKVHSPIHLCKGNEEKLISVFSNIKSNDWVCSTHRSHYHALLKGIPIDWLKAEILANHSISLNNAKYKFITSAIVGGIVPIAMGIAWAIKRRNFAEHNFVNGEKVWVFVGDMAAETGGFWECVKYSFWHQLPITFIIEDNGLSVNTPTQKVWGGWGNSFPNNVRWYSYKRGYPHHGAGTWINF